MFTFDKKQPFIMKYYLISAIFVLLSGITAFDLNDSSAQVEKSNKYFSIREINHNNFLSGEYLTEGYLVKIYRCPPCPSGAQCSPCLTYDHIVISEKNHLIDNYDNLRETDLIIYHIPVKDFVLGKKYQFLIRVLNTKNNLSFQKTNDLELVSFEEIKL